jgi:hypothetical protein
MEQTEKFKLIFNDLKELTVKHARLGMDSVELIACISSYLYVITRRQVKDGVNPVELLKELIDKAHEENTK